MPIKSTLDFPKWETWLEECLGILRHPRLVDPESSDRLSRLFRFIVDKRSHKLLGTLKAHWSSYTELINPRLATEISTAKCSVYKSEE
jgi:hypothetical protein